MMKLRYFLCGTSLMCFSYCNLEKVDTGQAPERKFAMTYGLAGSYIASDIKQTSDGGYIIAGSITDDNPQPNTPHVYLMKIDFEGKFLWEKTFHTDVESGAVSILINSDGGYTLTGIVDNNVTGNHNAQFLLKTDQDGTLVWSRMFSAVSTEYETYDFALSQDGGYLISGTRYDPNGSNQVLLRKCDPMGNSQWDISYPIPNRIGRGRSIRTTHDGGYVVGCRSNDSSIVNYMNLLRINASGTKIWQKDLQLTGVISDILETSDGGFVMVAWDIEGNLDDIRSRLVKTNSNGEILFNVIFDTEKWDVITGLQQTADGGFILAGSTNEDDTGSASDVYLIKTNAFGIEEWTRTYNFSDFEYGNEVELTSDGGFVVIGTSQAVTANAPSKILVLKTDGDGNYQ